MKNRYSRHRNEHGAGLIEHSALLGLIGCVCIVAVVGFGDSVGKFFCDLADNDSVVVSPGERKGLGFTSGQSTYKWNSKTHSCEVKTTGYGGGGFP